jgi:hypothetical protein
MTPYEIQRGREITPENWNSMVQQVRANTPKSGSGYALDKSPGGWALRMPRMASGGGGTTAAAAFCPFEVTTANMSPSEWKFKVEFGLIGGHIPTGMYPGGIPPLIMTWEDGWVLAYVYFVENQTTVLGVSIVTNPDIPENTADGAYYPLAYIFTDSTDPENPKQVIQNLCSQPTPSVCDLAFTA